MRDSHLNEGFFRFKKSAFNFLFFFSFTVTEKVNFLSKVAEPKIIASNVDESPGCSALLFCTPAYLIRVGSVGTEMPELKTDQFSRAPTTII